MIARGVLLLLAVLAGLPGVCSFLPGPILFVVFWFFVCFQPVEPAVGFTKKVAFCTYTRF